MPLLASQKSLLERCNVPKEHQKLLEDWLKGDESKKQASLDFLQLLSDLLQTAEKHLQIKRMELASKTRHNPGIISPVEAPAEILALEETIKTSWQTATSLWLAVDQVLRFPEEYTLEIKRDHAEYALATRNLPVLELLKWNKPEFFEIGKPSIFVRQFYWFLCGICGAFLGLIGGFLGGIREGLKAKPAWKRVFFPFYGLLGMLIGWSTSALRGARLGFRTGCFFLSCKLAFQAAYMSPFHAPRGSKKLQAVELKIEEAIFEAAKKGILNNNGISKRNTT